MKLQEVIDAFSELEEDSSVPKNIKQKIVNIREELESEKDLSLKVNKSLNELDDISDDVNIPTYIRTQIWSLSSMLEQLQ